jgi:CheY-like chemotaxis protein/anti-sigma regulatory factor (Ser/Thr protein kinase)
VPPTAPTTPLALVVDAAAAERRLACTLIEQQLGWRTREAASGGEALAALAGELPTAVLTDLQLPDGGLDLIDRVRQSYPGVPVVLLTAAGGEGVALEALRRGAASYVPKAELAAQLAASLEQVALAGQAARSRQRLLSSLTRVELEFELENDPALIPALVKQLQDQLAPLRLCDQNGLIRVGVALEEALVNAMYHGNLEVSSQLRQEDEAMFHRLIDERRQTAPYRDRRLRVLARLTPARAEFVITDEGRGYDPTSLPDPTNPANLETVGGRGLLLIRTFMDEIRFNPAGNQITMIKRPTPATPPDRPSSAESAG